MAVERQRETTLGTPGALCSSFLMIENCLCVAGLDCLMMLLHLLPACIFMCFESPGLDLWVICKPPCRYEGSNQDALEEKRGLT